MNALLAFVMDIVIAAVMEVKEVEVGLRVRVVLSLSESLWIQIDFVCLRGII